MSTTYSSMAHVEAEPSPGLLRINGQRMPLNRIGSRRQGFEPNSHDAGADSSLALIDSSSVGVAHLDRAEGRLERLGEGKGNFAGRGLNRAPDARLGVIEEGMGPSAGGPKHDEQS